MDTIRLLFALDANYLPQLRTLLTSIDINNPGERFELHVMHSGLPEEELARLAAWSEERGWAFSA